MKLSDLKLKVDAALTDVGDMDVVILTAVDGRFFCDAERDFDVISLEDNGMPVFAALPSDSDVEEGPSTQHLKPVP